jgi:glycosyltransferase involved in cell wall biosynthesis
LSPFTLVSTTFNEITRLEETIQDLAAQTVLPDEIIITDAGSTDGTYEAMKDWANCSKLNIRVLSRSGCNVAEGRNLAIENANYEIIVSTDFGCRFNKDWLRNLVSPFENPEVIIVGGGFTVEENDIITLPAKANYLLTNGYRITMDDGFIPSSRSIAYRKEVWEQVSGYDEWLTLAADDLVFGLKIKAHGYRFTWVKEQNVYWNRHTTFKAYVKEAYRYGLGDGEARVNVRNTLIVFAENLFRIGFLFSLITLGLIHIAFPFALSIGLFSLMGFRPYARAVQNWSSLNSDKYNFGVLLYSFLMIEATRWNYIKGFLKGYFFCNKLVKQGAKKLHQLIG